MTDEETRALFHRARMEHLGTRRPIPRVESVEAQALRREAARRQHRAPDLALDFVSEVERPGGGFPVAHVALLDPGDPSVENDPPGEQFVRLVIGHEGWHRGVTEAEALRIAASRLLATARRMRDRAVALEIKARADGVRVEGR